MQSQWHEAPEANRAAIESLDNFAELRNGIRRVATLLNEWAGIPMPLEGEQLVIEPNYPKAKELMAVCGQEEKTIPKETDDELNGAKFRSSFWSCAKRSTVNVIELSNGRITYGLRHGIHHFSYDLRTLGCSQAWGIEQESNAVHLLATLLRHHQFKQYMLTGMFLESSERSRVTYMFRRLKPTICMSSRTDSVKILCALCLHPIAYYEDSWAGAMCPTDDVIAHLMLMRGDEPMFWRRANQHAPHLPEAGL